MIEEGDAGLQKRIPSLGIKGSEGLIDYLSERLWMS